MDIDPFVNESRSLMLSYPNTKSDGTPYDSVMFGGNTVYFYAPASSTHTLEWVSFGRDRLGGTTGDLALYYKQTHAFAKRDGHTQSLVVYSHIFFDSITGYPKSSEQSLDTQTVFDNNPGTVLHGGTTEWKGFSGYPWQPGTKFWPQGTAFWYAAYFPITVWEISGAQFRFCGKNWTRLIKVSGP